jgi:hypothetical protein
MSCVPYASGVGSLMYATVCIRSDIAHSMGVLSRYMSKLRKEHWTTAKRVFRYLCGTTDYGICYQGRLGADRVSDIHGFVDVDWVGNLDRKRSNIHGFVDIDWVGNLDRKRSTNGYVFNLFGGTISWMNKR